MSTFIWKSIRETGLEHCEVQSNPITTIQGTIVTFVNSNPLSAVYKVICDTNGGTRTVHVQSNFDGTTQQFSLNRSSDNLWFKDGIELPEFQGLLDIDLGITPSTNTLPIRRLNLAIGEGRELVAVWVRFPECKILPLSQRYTRLDNSTYLYESTNGNYKARVEVDAEGIVTTYENVWERAIC